jgi:hypothetical protein
MLKYAAKLASTTNIPSLVISAGIGISMPAIV